MKRFTFAFLLTLMLSASTHACIQRYGTGRDGSRIRDRSENKRMAAQALHRAREADLTGQGRRMEETLRGKTDFQDRNDYAVALIYLGRSNEAIPLLQALEREKPGEYAIAANLGTAFELAGKNQDALKWINEGIRRNPDSHQGTEWLHVKILEAKLAAEKDPSYFSKHSVLNLEIERIKRETTILEVGDETIDSRAVAYAIYYQLGERLQFVRSSDPAVASLLFDLAALEAATETVESALDLLQFAAEYGYPVNRIAPLQTEYRTVLTRARMKRDVLVAGLPLCFLGFFCYALKRKWIVYTGVCRAEPNKG